jgi:5-(carboxyamino)imidazole ribonucleotide mutase
MKRRPSKRAKGTSTAKSNKKMRSRSTRRSSSPRSENDLPIVGIVMGSDTDLVWMEQAADALEQFGLPYELRIVSAHRTPELVVAYASSARSRGIRVIIAGAGGAAHLPGMIAAHTTVPVIGVPCPIGPMQGEDALWSIVQMPKGVPVATMAIGGGWNAGVLAAQMLAIGSNDFSGGVSVALAEHKLEMEQAVAKMNEGLLTSLG